MVLPVKKNAAARSGKGWSFLGAVKRKNPENSGFFLLRLFLFFFFPKTQDLFAVGGCRLFGFVVLELIVYPVFDFVRQVLLGIVMPRVRMGILITEAPLQFFGAGLVAVFEIGGDIAGLALLHVGHGRVDGQHPGVGFGRGA